MIRRLRRSLRHRLVYGWFGALMRDAVTRHPLIIGTPNPEQRVHLGKGVQLTNVIFNVASGDITVGDYTFIAHNALLLAATHELGHTGKARQKAIPDAGCDIVIGRGVFVATGATIIGPCVVGDNAVIGAGAVVAGGTVDAGTIVGGVPARPIGMVAFAD